MRSKNEAVEKLKGIVGADNISSDLGDVSRNFRGKVGESRLSVICPGSHDEVQNIVRIANEHEISIYTTYDTYLPQEIASKDGLILDFKRMDKIESIDAKNLAVHVQRGVTFGQLQDELKKHQRTLKLPAAATSSSVVENYVNRCVLQGATSRAEVQVPNMYVILADGRLDKTGSHALLEQGVDRSDPGFPPLGRWHLGAGDIFGIVTRATIFIYPIYQFRQVMAFGFDGLDNALGTMKEISRKELCSECLAFNARRLSLLLGEDKARLPAWTVIVSFESNNGELVSFQKRMVEQVVDRQGGRNFDSSLVETVSEKMAEAWMAPASHTSFYSLFKRVPEFDQVLAQVMKDTNYPQEEMGRLLIAGGLGRSVYCEYDFFAGLEDIQGMIDRTNERLVEQGAFFDRPLGKTAQAVYSRTGPYLGHMKQIKKMMDPKGILNPGQPVAL